ncbi:ribulose-5-phosphate 4-epimerase/fuculose-1-phosphate aldolase [Pseudomonas sp. TE3786]
MSVQEQQRAMWHSIRERLGSKHLQAQSSAAISTRVPGTEQFWFAASEAAMPNLVTLGADGASAIQQLHAQVYAARADIGAIASGCGRYGRHLLEVTGELPNVFDEQVRHLSKLMPGTTPWKTQLASGSNVLSHNGELLVLGMTGARLMLNAELFEKCAHAYVLAAATGKRIAQLPWTVRYLATRRLRKDQRRATARMAQGLLAEESKGY